VVVKASATVRQGKTLRSEMSPDRSESPTEPRDAIPTPRRRRKGGRSARVRAAAIRATVETLITVGIDGLSVAEVARRAGVHETSIYRRWGSKESLLLDSLLSHLQLQVPEPDTGSLRGDLLALFECIAEFMSSPLGQTLLREAARHDMPQYESVRDAFWAARLSVGSAVLHRAQARGEVRRGVNHRIALEMIVGLLTHRLLMSREQVDREILETTIDLILRGVTTCQS
jgi:AcrR family transcriptional regulator